MGFDLYANNEGVEPFHFDAFSWSWMLGRGVGLVIGYGEVGPAWYTYQPREVVVPRYDDETGEPTGEVLSVTTSPGCNDGYPVDADEAAAMAHAAFGLVAVERHVAKKFSELPAAEQERIRAMSLLDHARSRTPVREDLVEKVERFAEWAAKSGGFKVR